MLSLDNGFNEDEIREFDARIRRLLDTNQKIEFPFIGNDSSVDTLDKVY